MLTNPELKVSNRKIASSKFSRIVESVYYKEAPNVYRVSDDEIDSGKILCPKCKENMNSSFSAETGTYNYVCPSCGKIVSHGK